MSKFFKILHKSSKSNARVGQIITKHGIIETPTFVPVGTNGSIKTLDNIFIEKELNIQLLFCNTFHLLIHPGPEIIKNAGGLHKYINRKQPIITDSGGFQIFSLNKFEPDVKELKSISKRKDMQNNLVKSITEEGVRFLSYRDGKEIFLSPESSIDAQKRFYFNINL